MRCYPEPEAEPEPISRLYLACISPEQVRVMRSGVADCISPISRLYLGYISLVSPLSRCA